MGSWKIALFGIVVAMGGCSFASNNLLPSLTGEEPASKPNTTTAAAPAPTSRALK